MFSLVAFAAALVLVLPGCGDKVNVSGVFYTCDGPVTVKAVEDSKVLDGHVVSPRGAVVTISGVSQSEVGVVPIGGKEAVMKSASSNWALAFFGIFSSAVAAIASWPLWGNPADGSAESFDYIVSPLVGDSVLHVGDISINLLVGPPCTNEGQVPNLSGLTESVAVTTIQAACLVVGTVTRVYSETVPVGIVISSTPSTGTTADCGTPVNLVVSLGPAPANTGTVPDLAGLPQASAISAIQATCLVVGTITESYSDTVPAWTVISSNPAKGTVVVCGTPVNLVVSKGTAPVDTDTVPDLVGLPRADAVAVIGNTCLAVGTIAEAYHPTVPVGKVISSNPAKGIVATCGTPVNLVVSLGPAPEETSTVPNVVGMTQAAATATLTTANLVVGTVTEAYSATVPAGSVISTNPGAGSTVAKGSAVALVVSKGPEVVPVLGVTLITPLDGAVILAGSTQDITYIITGPNPVDVVIVNPDGKKSLLTEEELRALFEAKSVDKEVYRSFGIVPTGQPMTTKMVFLYTGNGLVTVAVKDTITGEIRTAAHSVNIVAVK
jgi:beta-lactam-binding protein with PASTA domain